MQVTQQTVFLRQAGDQPECERLMAAFYGSRPPVTTFVAQPPCCGAALAVEAWAIGGEGVRVERFGSPGAGGELRRRALGVLRRA